jgi:hypothetical protein
MGEANNEQSEGKGAPATSEPISTESDRPQSLWLRAWFHLAIAMILWSGIAILAVILHLAAAAIITAVTAVLIGVTGWFIAVHREDLHKRKIKRGTIVGATAVALAISLVAVGVVVIEYWTKKELVAPPLAGAATSTSASMTPTTDTPTQQPVDPLTADGKCNPANPTDWKIPDYQLCVINWCQGIVVFPNGSVDESRIQIKLRPRIFNNTAKPLDVTIWKPSALRLLVASSDLPDSWRPPPTTAAQGDAPSLVEVDGQKYYAIAPDLPKDVDLPTDRTKPAEVGFASFWSEAFIPPNSFWPPSTHRDANGNLDQDGDLVFQLPAKTVSNNATVGGLALLDRNDTAKVLAFAPFGPEKWGPRLAPMDF